MHFNNLLISPPKKHTIHSGCSSTFCMHGIFHALLSSADFFQNLTFSKILSDIRYQSVKQFQDRHSETVGANLGPNCLQRLLMTKDGTLLFIKSIFFN